MYDTDKSLIARTLKECVGYVLKDCEDAGFDVAALHLRIAMSELRALDTPQSIVNKPPQEKRA